MKVDEMTIGQVKEVLSLMQFIEGGTDKVSANSTAIEVGKAYLFRTVTCYYTGRVVAITDDAFVLEQAAWIPDTGRFYDALSRGLFNEVEPYPNGAIIFRQGCIDAAEWPHAMPDKVK